ncbi:MAG: carbon-nitrogen hydrolase family protein [Chloroflexi bacterium]|nr:carbon-nitrogen hydrolase family protein [Chloroflexota bacterium]
MKHVVRIGAAQLGPVTNDKRKTVERMVQLVEHAGKRGVEILSFPELALTPYFPGRVGDGAPIDTEPFFESDSPPAIAAPLIRLAKKQAMCLILPYAEKDGSKRYNSAIVIGPDGESLGKYRKMHIPAWVGPRNGGYCCYEEQCFSPGDLGFPVFRLSKATIGVQICYDRRFPESARSLALSGAQIIFSPCATPQFSQPSSPQIHPGELSVRASAHFNNCFCVNVGKAGVENGLPMMGDTFVVDPIAGDVIARSATDSDELVCAGLDLARLRVDTMQGRITDRRPEWYGKVTAHTGLGLRG